MGIQTPNRAALAYRAPGFSTNAGGEEGFCTVYVDGKNPTNAFSYGLSNGENMSDFYAANEFVVEVPAGEGTSSIGISIPHKGREVTRFVMRARVIVFPYTDEVIV